MCSLGPKFSFECRCHFFFAQEHYSDTALFEGILPPHPLGVGCLQYGRFVWVNICDRNKNRVCGVEPGESGMFWEFLKPASF